MNKKQEHIAPTVEGWEKHLEDGECFDFEKWSVENNLSESEKEMAEVLMDKILPRHMPYFDWNRPFAEASIVVLRPLLKSLLSHSRTQVIESIEAGLPKKKSCEHSMEAICIQKDCLMGERNYTLTEVRAFLTQLKKGEIKS